VTNAFKRSLAEGRTQIGLWQGLASPITAEICAGAGFDWLLFDGEHGPGDIPMLLNQLHAVSRTAVQPVARPPIGEPWLIKQYLDIGFRNLLIPLVRDANHAAELVRACQYAPKGIRGMGASRASSWGRDADYVHHADEDICLLVQIETREALAHVGAIAATEGVDGVFIGPADLSASLGHRGGSAHPEVVAEIEKAIAAIRAKGKAAGILSADAELARRYIALGCCFVAVGTDMGLLVRATDALAAEFGLGGAASLPAPGPY
jgi:4-hydroxy-2-oxoheptanedioate aldolase